MPMNAAGTDKQPYLRKLMGEHRALNRTIDTTKAIGAQSRLKPLKQLRLKLKDKIADLQSPKQARTHSA